MNENNVQPKLKIRNRILAIAIAFLLLTLMVPKMSFADGAADQTKDIATEEVNNTEAQATATTDAEPATNALNITGTVSSGDSIVVYGAKVSVFKGSERVSQTATTGNDGKFKIELYDSVAEGDEIMLMTHHDDFAFEVIATTADNVEKAINLKSKAEVEISALDTQTDRYDSFKLETTVGTQHSTQTYTETVFNYNFPVEGQFYMNERAHMYFKYTNSAEQEVVVHITANAKQWYKAFYWGAYLNTDKDNYFLLKVNEPYTLDSDKTYHVLPWFQGLAMLDFSSQSEGHDYFDINYIKNGAPYVNLQQANFQNTTYEDATCSVCEDGRIEIFYDASDEVNTYKVTGYITPVAKAGYKFSNWSYNGQALKVGEKITATTALNMAFVANYEVDASVSPKTGDANYLWVIALSGIVLASAVGAFRYRKNR